MTARCPLSEPEKIKALVDIMTDFSQETPTPDLRSEHPKGVADVTARFRVLDHLPEECRVGLFAEAGEYDAVIRFSNSAAMRDDQRDTHGMAVQVKGVPMATSPCNAAGETIQDFILIDSPTFVIGDLGTYVPFAEAFMQAKLNLMGKLKMGLLVLQNLTLLPGLMRLGLKRPNAPLGTPYWSTTPYRLGDLRVKYKAVPIGSPPSPTAIRGREGRRKALARQLAIGPGLFSFCVIISDNRTSQPIDDPSVDWEETGARVVPLAEIHIPDQAVDAPPELEDALGFSPGHASREHAPLGEMNRARVAIYAAARAARQKAAARR